MKKKYAGLVNGFRIVALLLFLLGAVVGLVEALSWRGSIVSGLMIFASALLSALFLNAIAAGIDLLATIEVNTRTTANYFERRTSKPGQQAGAHPLTRRPTPGGD